MKRSLLSICFYFFIVSCNPIDGNEEIVQGISQFPQILSPLHRSTNVEIQISMQLYEPLLEIKNDVDTIRPGLAVQWTSSADHKIYTFELRPDVYFHDGSKLTAEDIALSFKVQKNIQQTSIIFEMIDSVKVVDHLKIAFYLKHPSPVFLQALASPYGLIIFKPIKGNSIPAGTGPYKLKSIEPDEWILLSQFKKYWGKKGKVKRVRFRYYKERRSIENAIVSDKVDVIYLVPGHSIDRLKWLKKIEYYVQQPSSVFFLGFNNAVAPFNDRRIRKAVLKAINIPILVLNTNRGNAAIAKGPLPETFFPYTSQTQENFDLHESKKLLKEAGYEKGLNVNLIFPSMAFNRAILANILQADLAKANIHLKLIYTKTWQEHDRLINSDSCHLFITGGRPEIAGDMESMLRDFFYSQSPFNLTHYHNKYVDNWLDEARVEMNPPKRNRLIRLVVKQILEDIPAVFLYHVKPHFAFNREKIKKLVVDPYGIIQYHRLELR